MNEQRILITGGAKRIGRRIAESLARPDRTLIIHYNRSSDEADELVAALRAGGATAHAIGQDLSEASAAVLIDRASEVAGGPLSVLINNASVYGHDWPTDMNVEVFDQQMAVNARAPMALAAAFQRQVDDAVDNVIVNFLDQKLWNLHPHYYSYTTSKAAFLAAMKMMDQAWHPSTRICAIAPGHLLPNADQTDAEYDALASENLLQRPIDVEGVPRAVQYILETRSFHGQVVFVDNGLRFWKEDWSLHNPARK
ncbi:SDR family NAD(P)-dependent oxidoreductase [Parvularcula sp. LCG005]|uniref:SDR family NAD(P)-dependent oxidoreductase n=1 Tax=Parvularcula sp. LCG005 TaxID=3078805 RepID=UPI0029428514|nr:SDR family NAD(P)-dependent oxidoreductase [Parvularcula sp. LCG005]WOI54715.1 SDR family NAD(P)-dependent oxidoreductase [Parvularcula sp. LCG005]